jgi:hypothetical protein
MDTFLQSAAHNENNLKVFMYLSKHCYNIWWYENKKILTLDGSGMAVIMK